MPAHALVNDGRVFDSYEWHDGKGHAHCICGVSSKDPLYNTEQRKEWLENHKNGAPR